MVPQAMIWVMPSTDTARQGPTNMSRRLGIASAVFTERAVKAREHDPEKWEPVFGSDHALTKNLCRHLGLGEGWYLRREAVEPGDELGMRGAPVAGEAKVAGAEEARQRNLADIGQRIERRQIGLQRGQAALDLVGLIIGPPLNGMLRRPEAAFV